MNKINLNSNKILNFQATETTQSSVNTPHELGLPDVQIPDIYYTPKKARQEKSFKETVKKVDLMGVIYPWLEYPLLMIGTCAGLSWGVDKFSAACGGDFEKSLVGKAARFGDKIEQSKVIQSKPVQTTLGWGKSGAKKIGKFFKDSDLINAIRKTPSKPEWGIVKDELFSMEQRVVRDFNNVISTLRIGSEGVAELSQLGLNKADHEFLNKFFSGSAVTEEQLSNAIQLKRIGYTDDAIKNIISSPDASNIVKAKQLEKMGLNEEFIAKIRNVENVGKEEIKTVREACKKARGIRIGEGYQKWLGNFQFFGNHVGLDEIGNRLSSMSEAKTKTGRAFATFLQKVHRGFTFGGNKMTVLFFVSPLLVETMIDIKKADRDQKVGTTAHGLINSCSWVFTFPAALGIMHHLAGAQYAGMSPEKVEECRKLIKEFNEKAEPYLKGENGKYLKEDGKKIKKAITETFQSHDEYIAARKKLREELSKLKKVKDQNLLTKISKGLGKFLTMDLETVASYKNGTAIGNTLRKVPNFFRNLGGIPLRFAVWAGIAMGVLDTIINKCVGGIFGKHYDRFKEEEHQEAKKQQKIFLKDDLQKRLLEAQKAKISGQPEEPIPTIDLKNVPFEIPKTPRKNNSEIKQTSSEQLAPAPTKLIDLENKEKAPLDNTEKTENKELSNVTPKKENSQAVPVNKEVNTPNLEQAEPIKEDRVPVQEKKGETFDKNKNSENDNITEQNPSEPIINEIQQKSELKEEVIRLENPDNYSYIPDQNSTIKTKPTEKRDNYTYIPSQENVLGKKEENLDVNKYIPSQQAGKFSKTFDNSGLEAALRRADRAEQQAIQILNGKFN